MKLPGLGVVGGLGSDIHTYLPILCTFIFRWDPNPIDRYGIPFTYRIDCPSEIAQFRVFQTIVLTVTFPLALTYT